MRREEQKQSLSAEVLDVAMHGTCRTATENDASLPENVCSGAIVGASIEVHRQLGPGLLESAYEAALAHELASRGHWVDRQVMLPVVYKNQVLQESYRVDLIVDRLVIVEIKALAQLSPIHEVQLLTYLRFSNKRVGLLLNFHALTLRQGIRRVVNGL